MEESNKDLMSVAKSLQVKNAKSLRDNYIILFVLSLAIPVFVFILSLILDRTLILKNILCLFGKLGIS